MCVARLSPESLAIYVRLEEKWSASVSTLAWEASRSTKHKLRWCSHTWTRCTGPVRASALFTSLFTSSIITRGTAWERGPYRSRALSTARAQVAKKSYKKCRSVRTLARVDKAVVWVEIFMSGKFRDTGVNHGNNLLYGMHWVWSLTHALQTCHHVSTGNTDIVRWK